MKNLLEVDGLRTWFPIHRGILSRTVGFVRAVDGVSLQIGAGETVGLVGESGCGKTTLARTILRLDPAREGAVRFDGEDLLKLPARRLRKVRREIQVVFQDPFSSLNPRMTVMDIVTEGMVEHGLIPGSDRARAAESLLSDVGLGPDAMQRYPHEFSGGQRQRISVARAISLHPRLIICDEPVSALDVSVQAQVLNLLVGLRQRFDLSYLFISHDLNVVRYVSSRMFVMYLGQIVEEGPSRDIMEAPGHPYTRALISAVPRVGVEKRERIVLAGDVPSPANPPSGCRFHPRCPYAVDACARIMPALEPLAKAPGTGRRVACLRKDEI